MPVEVSGESISENDPSSSPLVTNSGYAMAQTLGRRVGRSIVVMMGVQSNSLLLSVLAPTNWRSGTRLANISE